MLSTVGVSRFLGGISVYVTSIYVCRNCDDWFGCGVHELEVHTGDDNHCGDDDNHHVYDDDHDHDSGVVVV